MKLQGAWMLPVILLLVAGSAGRGEEPQQAADEPKPKAAKPDEGRESADSTLDDQDAVAALNRLDAVIKPDEDGRVVEVVFPRTKRVTDADLVHLGKLPRLTRLQLPNLQTLLLRANSFSDQGLVHLADLSSLQKLFLGRTRATDEGVKKLQQALPNCKVHHKPLPRRR